ncbi:MAG: hypothetical protein K9J80_17180, partial [Sulfuritalea sp.]|nr:hypothetical protein [Sulfuritalea sp.]
LYELVWSTPMIRVAEKFEVSGSYLARVCTELRVPRPERGYWAKLAVGKAPQRPALPEPLPGDPFVWSRADGLPAPVVPTPRQAPTTRTSRPSRPVVGIHGLIRGAKVHFLAGRKVDDDSHLKPYKKLLVDITASRSGLDKALDFANELFNALESAGHRVVIAPSDAHFQRERITEKEVPPKKEPRYDPYGYDRCWSPFRPTVVYVDTIAFGLALIEMTESVEMRYVNGNYIRESEYVPPKTRRYVDHTWTTTRDLPSGRMRLVVYSPYRNVSWSATYQEATNRTLTQDIPQIVKSIESEVAPIIEKLQEAERQAEIWRLERLAEEERRRQEDDWRCIALSVKESREQLEQVIQAWSNVIRLEEFFRGVEDRAQHLPESEHRDVLERLRLAREFVGTQEPLDFFRGWKTPLERYVPLSNRSPGTQPTQADDDDDEDSDEGNR